MDTHIDARGKACPLPVIETKNALAAMAGPGILTVRVDNEIAVQNVLKLSAHKNLTAVSEKLSDDDFQVRIQVGPEGLPADTAPAEAAPSCVPDGRGGAVVVVSSREMGSGDPALGAILMKSFLFALTKQDVLPAALLFYNGGAFLTCQGSESLEDLKSLEAQGVEITTCGTCLDFYGLKDKLAVGTVSNMYDIVEKQLGAALVLRP